MSTKRFLSLLAVAANCTVVLAQGDAPQKTEYYFQSLFDRVVGDVRKVDLRPVPYDSILPTKPLTYELIPVKGVVEPRVDSIAPVKLNVVQPQEKLYHGFAKGGFGLYTTPLLELFYDQTRSRKNGYGFHYKHFSSNGGLNDVGPSDYSFNNVDAFYKGFFKHHEFGGKVMYDRRRVNFYGYSPDKLTADSLEQPSESQLKMIYNDIGFQAHLKSLYRDSTLIAHDVAMEVHQYADLKSVRSEFNLRLSADLSKEDGSEMYGLGVFIDNNAYRNKDIDLRQNGVMIGLTPNVSTEGDNYLVKVGVGMYLDAQSKTTFHFFPQACAQYSLFDDILVPYLGVDGFRQRNSFRSLSRENPWLSPLATLQNSSQLYDIYGGLRGSFSSDLGFDVRLSKSRMKDRPLYVNDGYSSTLVSANELVGLGSAFDVVYDRVDQLDISGAITYSHDEHVTITGRLDIFSYDTDKEAEPWNLPPYAISLLANWDIQDKLIIKGELQFMGRRTALSYSGYDVETIAEVPPTQHELDGYLDMYLGAEYRYNKRLSVFVDVSNLSASKYERWYRYPVQRTMFLGGATFAF